MSPDPYIQLIIEFVRVHHAWAAPAAFVFAFLESLVLLSLVIPGWAALVALGALIGASGIPLWPVWLAGAVGAALGDWVSYWLGYCLKGRVIELSICVTKPLHGLRLATGLVPTASIHAPAL